MHLFCNCICNVIQKKFGSNQGCQRAQVSFLMFLIIHIKESEIAKKPQIIRKFSNGLVSWIWLESEGPKCIFLIQCVKIMFSRNVSYFLALFLTSCGWAQTNLAQLTEDSSIYPRFFNNSVAHTANDRVILKLIDYKFMLLLEKMFLHLFSKNVSISSFN